MVLCDTGDCDSVIGDWKNRSDITFEDNLSTKVRDPNTPTVIESIPGWKAGVDVRQTHASIEVLPAGPTPTTAQESETICSGDGGMKGEHSDVEEVTDICGVDNEV